MKKNVKKHIGRVILGNKVENDQLIDLSFELRERVDRPELQWVSENRKELGKTLYIIPETAPIVPSGPGIRYRCELGYKVHDSVKLTIQMVRILSRLVEVGDIFYGIRFEYGKLNPSNRSEKCMWRGYTKVGNIDLVFWVHTDQIDLLGARIPGNNPVCEVRLQKLIDQTVDGDGRIYGVKILKVDGAKPLPLKKRNVDSKPVVGHSLSDLVACGSADATLMSLSVIPDDLVKKINKEIEKSIR